MIYKYWLLGYYFITKDSILYLFYRQYLRIIIMPIVLTYLKNICSNFNLKILLGVPVQPPDIQTMQHKLPVAPDNHFMIYEVTELSGLSVKYVSQYLAMSRGSTSSNKVPEIMNSGKSHTILIFFPHEALNLKGREQSYTHTHTHTQRF